MTDLTNQLTADDDIISALVDIQYTRNEIDFKRGTFRAKGDVLEVIPANSDKVGFRIEFFGDEIEAIYEQMKDEREGFDMMLDGMVIKVNQIEAQEEMGYTVKNPRWSSATPRPRHRKQSSKSAAPAFPS